MKKDVTAIAKPEFSLIDENMLKFADIYYSRAQGYA
jgi:hypothetical protein